MSEHLPLVAMYMALGADKALTRMSDRVYEEFIDDKSGHLGVMNDYVLEVAKHVAMRLDERGEIDDWPGVFDYEVSEPLGDEVIRLLYEGCTIETANFVADKMISEFFNK